MVRLYRPILRSTERYRGEAQESTHADRSVHPTRAARSFVNKAKLPDVDAESHRAGALGGTVATKADEPFAIEGRDVALPQMSLEHIEGCGLGAARGLAYIAHVVDMKVDEFAERFQARYAGLG